MDGTIQPGVLAAPISETSDLALLLFPLHLYSLARGNQERVRTLLQYLVFFIVLLFISGTISLFSEYRLSNLLRGRGFEISALNRVQHPLVNLGSLFLYKPLGLINNRLSYGELVALILPFTVFLAVNPPDSFWKKIPGWVRKGLPAMGLLLLFANGSRSAMIGAGVALVLAPFFLWRKKTSNPAYQVFATIAISTLAIALVTFSLFRISGSPTRLENTVGQFFRHTDHQRVVIWKLAGDLFLDSPWMGVGPSRFPETAVGWKREMEAKEPELLYWIENTPHKHAHNDLLHFLAIGGVPAGIFYLIIFVFIFLEIGKGKREGGQISDPAFFLYLPSLIFLFSGLSQCYFLDDESLQFFWSLMGLAAASRTVDPGNRPDS